MNDERKRVLPPRAALLPFDDERWQGHARLTALLNTDGSLKPWGASHWPKVTRETIVDVLVPLGSLPDEDRQRFRQESDTVLLPKGTEVRFRISNKSIPASLTHAVIDGTDAYPDPGSMVAVRLLEDLILKVRSSGLSKLAPARCGIDSLNESTSNLNEAYRRLSEVFESHRRSYGGSVFLQAYYLDDGMWLQLDALRRWIEAGRSNPVQNS